VGKGGVVRDPDAHVDAINGVIAAAQALGLEPMGLVASPITGPAGNHEYLLWLQDAIADCAPAEPSQPAELSQNEGARPPAVTAETVRQVVAQTLG
jgi:hypothetical protein